MLSPYLRNKVDTVEVIMVTLLISYLFYIDLGSYDMYVKLENLFYEVLFETPFSNARV